MKKTDAITLYKKLKEYYPDATCSLDFDTPFQMVVAVMLSAQCTDERVNKTTPALFERCKTIQDFANIDIKELENIIHPCGFYKSKAKNIKLCAKQVLENFNGIVPHTMDELTSLAGVGRKSANVVMLEAFGIAEGIAVDTHAKRISNLTGLSKAKEPEKIEQDLIKTFEVQFFLFFEFPFLLTSLPSYFILYQAIQKLFRFLGRILHPLDTATNHKGMFFAVLHEATNGGHSSTAYLIPTRQKGTNCLIEKLIGYAVGHVALLQQQTGNSQETADLCKFALIGNPLESLGRSIRQMLEKIHRCKFGNLVVGHGVHPDISNLGIERVNGLQQTSQNLALTNVFFPQGLRQRMVFRVSGGNAFDARQFHTKIQFIDKTFLAHAL